MIVYYKVTREESCNLNIKKLAQLIIDENDSSEIIDFWQDNMEYFLNKLKFYYFDGLNDKDVTKFVRN